MKKGKKANRKNYFYSMIMLFILTLNLYSCLNKPEKTFNFYPGVFKFTIIDFDQKYFYYLDANKPYKLNYEDFVKAENFIRIKIQNLNKKLSSEDKKFEFEDYYIQYMAGLNDKNEINIIVKGSCREPGEGWRKSMIEVLDGGCCFFTSRINITTGKHSKYLGCNGEA